ncbi:MAG: hypothetical protein ACK52I_25020 [Pseudomonadota bacterium]|jgi:hypothetical protein
MLFLSFFQKADTGSEKISGIILSVLTIGILLITFKIQKFLKSEFDFDFNFERKVAFYEPIVTIVLLVVHSNLFAIVKHEMIDQNTRIIRVITKDNTLDSLKYLGKTNNEFLSLGNLLALKVNSTRLTL